MMSSISSIFSFQALVKLDLEVLEFWLFTELSILDGFWLGFSNMQEFPYVHISKVQSLCDQVHGRFHRYENFLSCSR